MWHNIVSVYILNCLDWILDIWCIWYEPQGYFRNCCGPVVGPFKRCIKPETLHLGGCQNPGSQWVNHPFNFMKGTSLIFTTSTVTVCRQGPTSILFTVQWCTMWTHLKPTFPNCSRCAWILCENSSSALSEIQMVGYLGCWEGSHLRWNRFPKESRGVAEWETIG